MTTPTNTLAHGATVQQEWAGLGGYRGKMVPPLQSLTGALIGFGGAGKSALLQGMPNNYIFNLDRTSTTCPNPKATMWPGIDSTTGALIDSDGTPMILTWDKVLEKIEVLKKLAKEDRPRPTSVTFDSMYAMIRLLMDWIPRNAGKIRIGASDPEGNWNSVDGRAAWDWLHRQTANVINDLHGHGYGVWTTLHLKNQVIPLGENESVIRPGFTITDSHWGKIADIFGFLGAISKEQVSRTENIVKETKTAGGAVVKSNGTRVVTETVYQMAIDVGNMRELTKQRLPLPEVITIPHEGGWDHLAKVWDEARTKYYNA